MARPKPLFDGSRAWLAAMMLAGCSARSPIPEGAELIPSDATFAISVDVPAIQNRSV
jgi:hypothetical protein